MQLSKKLNRVTGSLVNANDRQLGFALADKDLQVQTLRDKSDTAERRIAFAQAEAETARLATEQEKVLRLQLEAKIAPRRLSADQQRKMGGACAAMYGRTLHLRSYANDPEGAILAFQIADAFLGAHLRVSSSIGRLIQAGVPEKGIRVRGAPEDAGFINCVTQALSGIGSLEATANGPRHRGAAESAAVVGGLVLTSDGLLPAGPLPTGSDLTILVGVKPFEEPTFAAIPVPRKP